MADALWYWHRFRAMGIAELWHRVVGKAKHIAEPFALGAIKNVRLTQEPADCPSLPSREAAPALLKQTLACDAARLLDGKWSLFGWKEVQVSLPPDWHRDYMRGVSVPVNGKLNHRSLPDGADVRTIWEINRWAEPVRLAMHGWLNDDVDATTRAQSWLADWVGRNPVGEGINWTSALEAGLRLINICWFDAFVSQTADGRSQMGQMQLKLRDAIVPAHVWWTRRHLSYGSSANNHRLGELTGLLMAVKRWPEMESIAGKAEGLWDQIAGCMLAQFAEDGGNREQALHYHLFAFELVLHACRAMNVNSGPVVERLQRAAEFFVRMSHSQDSWDYGDNDDAQIVPLTMRRDKVAAEWCVWMLKETGSGATALNFWLGGSSIQNTKYKIQNRHWWIAKESGMAVIECDGWKVRVDASPLGFGKMAAHGHCDALHVSIWDGEHALVIDPGTGGYYGAEKLRAELASWNAHNGPQPVGGFKTPRRMGTFLWAEHHRQPVARLVDDVVVIEHKLEGLRVKRAVTANKMGVCIEDSASGDEMMSTRWCMAPECRIDEENKKRGEVVIRRENLAWQATFQGDVLNLVTEYGKSSQAFGRQDSCATIYVVSKGSIKMMLQRISNPHVS